MQSRSCFHCGHFKEGDYQNNDNRYGFCCEEIKKERVRSNGEYGNEGWQLTPVYGNWECIKFKHKNIIYRLLEDQTIAIWPYEKATMDGLLESYMIIGQHGHCSPEHIDNLPEPSEEQIAEMKAELQRIGYQT